MSAVVYTVPAHEITNPIADSRLECESISSLFREDGLGSDLNY